MVGLIEKTKAVQYLAEMVVMMADKKAVKMACSWVVDSVGDLECKTAGRKDKNWG